MMKVCISGIGPQPPEKITVPKGANLCREILKILKEFEAAGGAGSALISVPTGAGKTYSTIHGVVPYALENGLHVLYISSRVAINTQLKEELVEQTGQAQLKRELTHEGMCNKTDFNGVDVMTYHKLHYLMQYHPESLKKYDILVFDEVHALLDDSIFVGYTAQVLDNLDRFFGHAIRLYLSATPDAILPVLPWSNRPYPNKILHMPRNYSYIVPHFFVNKADLLHRINEDSSSQKWLIYMPYISDAREFCRELHHSYCMLNGEERERDPDKWHQVLEKARFEEKVCVVTSIIDAGVNLKDPALVNIVVFSTNPSTYKQVLGRKRRVADEKVHLYAWCPMPEDIARLMAKNCAIREAIDSFQEGKSQFISQYLLQPQQYDLRGLMGVYPSGDLVPNRLARLYLQNEYDLLVKIQRYTKEHKDPACFDRFVTRWLSIPLPDRADSWLDGRFSGEARLEFLRFLDDNCGLILDEEGFTEFSKEFQHKCIGAYGKAANGRDRDDRLWKEKKINNKLLELELPYKIDCNNLDKTYCLLKRKAS